MTLTLDLPSDLERELAAEAAKLGLPLAEYALRVLAGNRVNSTYSGAPQNGEELVSFWKEAGVVGSRPEIADPAAHAHGLRGRAERRVRGDA